jgi:hypothetical protein
MPVKPSESMNRWLMFSRKPSEYGGSMLGRCMPLTHSSRHSVFVGAQSEHCIRIPGW